MLKALKLQITAVLELLKTISAQFRNPQYYFVFLNWGDVDSPKLISCKIWISENPEILSMCFIIKYIILNFQDIFLLCYSVVNSSSHQNVTSKWIPELRHHCPNTPIILVGTKYDLTEDYDTITNLAKKKEMPKNTKDGEDLCEKLKAIKYV